MFTKTQYLPECVHLAARPVARTGWRSCSRRAGRRPAGPGHDGPVADVGRRQIHSPDDVTPSTMCPRSTKRSSSTRSRLNRCSACWTAWCWMTIRNRSGHRLAWRGRTAFAIDVDRGQVPPGQAHGGRGGQSRRVLHRSAIGGLSGGGLARGPVALVDSGRDRGTDHQGGGTAKPTPR